MNASTASGGGSKATIYRHFESKQALFSAIVDELRTTLGAAPAVQDVADLPLVEGVQTLARATAKGALSERAIVLLRLAAGEYNRLPELAHLLFELAPGRSYARFVRFLEAKQRCGEIHVDDFQIASEQFLAGIVGHLQLRLLLGMDEPTASDVDRRIDAAVRAVICTYGTDEQTP